MDVLHSIALGFATALTWQNLIYCFIGVFVGTVMACCRGWGRPTISLLLPISFIWSRLRHHPARRHLLRRQYGGSITRS